MGKPYAKVDVALRDHPKAVEVGPAAMGIWLGALLYIREHLTDGFAPRQVVFSSFAASPQLAACCVRRLVSAGLFVEVPGGFLLANYSEKNQTKVQVTAAIDSARERMRRVRESRKCSPEVRANIHRTNAFVPPSPSPIDQGSGSGEVQEGGPPAAAAAPLSRVPSNADPPPDWFVEAVAGVAMATGEDLRVPECWLLYAGHRASKPHVRPGPADARYWVTSVCVPKVREERQRRALAGSRMRPDEPKPAPYHSPGESVLDRPLDGPAVDPAAVAGWVRGLGQ